MSYFDQLIATLMQVVIQNAGAETGALVLLEEDQLTVVAQCSGSRQCYLKKLAVADCATIPFSVIHSVANFIAEDDFVTSLGDITMKDKDGKAAHYS
jgi:transaldolase